LSPLYMTQIYDRVLSSRSVPTLMALTLGVSLCYGLYTLLEALRSRILVQAGLALDRLLTEPVLKESFAGAARLGGARHAGHVRDVATVRQYLTGNGLFAFFDAPWGLLFLVIIFIVHWALGLVALAGMALLVGLAVWDHVRTRPLLMQSAEQARESGRRLDAALRNAEVVRALGMADAIATRWHRGHQGSLVAQAQASNSGGTALALTKGARQLLQSLMLAVGAYLVIADNLSPGVMLAATILLGKATAPVELAIGGWKQLVEAKAAYGRLDKLLKDSHARAEPMPMPEPQGALQVSSLVFAAGTERPPILSGISFELEPGECMAVIGPSGSGKSSLLRLLLGIWAPSSGMVRLDGFDVAQWPSERLGPWLGYLPQDVELFEGTVAENIARLGVAAGCADAVIAAARAAGVHERVQQMPQGYDTQIGPAGQSLSGGQRQLLGLARALFGKPRLLMLDEPNSNLDAQGEAALVEALAQAKQQGTTVIYVTHKPSLLSAADKVLVLDTGRVKAFGPRDTVLNPGALAKMTRPLQAVQGA
ncbi:type I secretion system permease/ATPase, partial [Paucibacter soli]|uniref:type I secretion system permease/ATPase n=1 Tax=Paucibacter soli TaxID=3133433 RepID=UPI003096AA99